MIKTTYEKNQMDDKLPVRILLFDDTEHSQLRIADLNSTVQQFVPPHWHRSIEMTYVMKGVLNLKSSDYTGKILPGEFLLVNSGVLHEISNDPSNDVEIIVFIISYDFLKETIPNFDEVGFDIKSRTDSYQELSQLFIEIRSLYLRNERYDYLKIRARLLEIISILMDKHLIDYAQDSKNHLHAREVLDYIHENYSSDLKLNDVAKKYHVSREHFSREFKKNIGITFSDYLMNYRIYQAFADIVNSKDTIQEIALRHGFPSTKSLITQFKRKYDLTPSAYRKTKVTTILDHNEFDNINQSI